MKVKLDAYLRGFKDVPQLPKSSNSAKAWASIPVRMYVDSTTGEERKVLLIAFSPKLRFVTKELAQQILAKYSGFERIKFLPKRFIPAPVEEKLQVPLDCLI